MKYSIITTIYNDEERILDFLNELMNQSYLPEEIIIADGGSQDHTLELIHSYHSNNDVKIKLLEGKRLNIPQGFNKAICNASNEIIVIVAIGNNYPPNFCRELIYEIIKDPSIDAVYCPIIGKETTKFSHIYNKAFIGDKPILNIPSNHGVLLKKSAFQEMGFFYENFVYAGEDFEFFQHFAQKKKTKCINTTNVYWETPSSYSEFKKQVKYYLIGNMQIYTNTLLFTKLINKRLFYILMWCMNLILLIKKGLNQISIVLSTFLFFINFKWIAQCGLDGCILKNIRIGLEIIYLFKEKKYLISKNKIPKKRRLNRVI